MKLHACVISSHTSCIHRHSLVYLLWIHIRCVISEGDPDLINYYIYTFLLVTSTTSLHYRYLCRYQTHLYTPCTQMHTLGENSGTSADPESVISSSPKSQRCIGPRNTTMHPSLHLLHVSTCRDIHTVIQHHSPIALNLYIDICY